VPHGPASRSGHAHASRGRGGSLSEMQGLGFWQSGDWIWGRQRRGPWGDDEDHWWREARSDIGDGKAAGRARRAAFTARASTASARAPFLLQAAAGAVQWVPWPANDGRRPGHWRARPSMMTPSTHSERFRVGRLPRLRGPVRERCIADTWQYMTRGSWRSVRRRAAGPPAQGQLTAAIKLPGEAAGDHLLLVLVIPLRWGGDDSQPAGSPPSLRGCWCCSSEDLRSCRQHSHSFWLVCMLHHFCAAHCSIQTTRSSVHCPFWWVRVSGKCWSAALRRAYQAHCCAGRDADHVVEVIVSCRGKDLVEEPLHAQSCRACRGSSFCSSTLSVPKKLTFRQGFGQTLRT
jgi:hypothetical protein